MDKKLDSPPGNPKSIGTSVKSGFQRRLTVKKRLAPPPDRREKRGDQFKDLEEQRLEARRKAEKLRAAKTVEKKQMAVETLNQAVSEMTSMAQQVSCAIEQQASAFTEINTNASEISNSADRSLSAANVLSRSAQQASDSAGISEKKITLLQSLVRSTTARITDLITGMNKTADHSRDSVQMINKLVQNTTEIEKKLTGVIQAADRISLLAVNAAIEASRAGEHGAGFSVIADEIRKLAGDAEVYATKIIEGITLLQKSVQTVQNDLGKTRQQAEEDADRANKITIDLTTSTKEMDSIRIGAMTIGDRSAAQADLVTQLVALIAQVASGAQESAAACEKANTALEQQSKALESIVENAEDVQRQADTLEREKFSQDIAEELATNTEELSAIIEEANAVAGIIDSSISDIAQAAEQQSQVTQSNLKIVEKSENAASEILTNVQISLTTITSQQELLKSIDQQSQMVIESISATAASNRDSVQQIKSLELTLSGLERIIMDLTTLNILSNMLAVSGSVESARAGEHGIGFGEVSADIRILVDQSVANVADISDSIRSVRESITTISAKVEIAGVVVSTEIDKAKVAISDLAKLEHEMAVVAEGSSAIQAAADEALSVMKDLKIGIDEISESAESSVNATQEASSVSGQQAQAFMELASVAMELASQADEL